MKYKGAHHITNIYITTQYQGSRGFSFIFLPLMNRGDKNMEVAFEPIDATRQRYLTVPYGTDALCRASEFAVRLGAHRWSGLPLQVITLAAGLHISGIDCGKTC